MKRMKTAMFGAALAILTLAGPSLGGDRALIDILGYSSDARYFAFEEFGIQDGSGFAYSSLFIIDLQQDAWTPGSPFRMQADDEAVSLSAIRERAKQAAQAQLDAHVINRPAEIIAMQADGVAAEDELRFGVPTYGEIGAMRGDYSLSLEQFELPATEPCVSYTNEPVQGFALTLRAQGLDRLLHRDANVPKSRNCPLAYALYAVVLPFEHDAGPDRGVENDLENGVAILSVYQLGFEGPSRRFLALPLTKK